MIAIGRIFVFMISVAATMSAPPKIEGDGLISFFLKIVNLHNEFRRIHEVPIVKLDKKLSDDARDIRDRINNNQSNSIFKDIGMNKGEGVFPITSDQIDVEARRLFLEWYNTGVGYNYEIEPSKKTAEAAAPFTQIVWKNTTKIGISLVEKEDGTYDIVVTYGPKGNKKKHYKKNVFRPKE